VHQVRRVNRRGLNVDVARAALAGPTLDLGKLFADKHALFGDLRMEDPDDKGKGDDPDKGDKDDPDKGKPAAKFDQAQVDRFTGTARNEGRQAAMKELADELGVPDGDDADPDGFITTAVGLVTAKVGDDDDAIKAAVEKLKATMPPLFTKAADKDDDDKGGGSLGPGNGPRGGNTRSGTFGEKGLAEAQRRGWVDKDGKPISATQQTARTA
jgi:hypothetical protein